MVYMVKFYNNTSIFPVDNTKMTLHLSSPKDMARTGELKILLSGTVIRLKKKGVGKCNLIYNTFVGNWRLHAK